MFITGSAHEKLMFNMPGAIHFIGIGGIGMSGIAEILLNFGYIIQGSDVGENDNILRLKNLGAKIFIGHHSGNIKKAALVVISSAIKPNNPEIEAARKSNIPIVKRSEMLAELMRFKVSIAVSGSHGKTTTTALIASLFEKANLNPTVINGGIINTHGTNAYLGSGDYLIAEADESDGTFIRIPSCISVITNIDPEHLDYYKTFDNLKNAYRQFIEGIPFYGFTVACKDHPIVNEIISTITDREVITYGIDSEELDFKAINIIQNEDGSYFDVVMSSKISSNPHILKNVYLPILGKHNILNALSAITIGVKLKIDHDILTSSFENFQGVKRRFTKTGEINKTIIIDDYAHHPEEIKATLNTAKELIKNSPSAKIIAILQPHRYSRLQNLFSDFVHSIELADTAIIADIYGAGEQPINGINQEVFVSAIRSHFVDKQIISLDHPENLCKIICSIMKPGDVVICMGAGSITTWAKNLPQEIEQILKDN